MTSVPSKYSIVRSGKCGRRARGRCATRPASRRSCGRGRRPGPGAPFASARWCGDLGHRHGHEARELDVVHGRLAGDDLLDARRQGRRVGDSLPRQPVEEDRAGAIGDEEALDLLGRVVAHHPTTPTVRPSEDATFQMAGTARDRPEIGILCPVAGSTPWKSSTRWTSGPTPVASVVQTTGDRIGMYDLRRAV